MPGKASIQPNNAASAAGDYVERVQVVDSAGVLAGATAAVTTATLANVASSASSVTLFAANTAARVRTVYNDSTAVLYIKFGPVAASASSYTVQVVASGYYEF